MGGENKKIAPRSISVSNRSDIPCDRRADTPSIPIDQIKKYNKVTQFTLHQTHHSSKSLQLITRLIFSLVSPVLFQVLGLVAYQSYLTLCIFCGEGGTRTHDFLNANQAL